MSTFIVLVNVWISEKRYKLTLFVTIQVIFYGLISIVWYWYLLIQQNIEKQSGENAPFQITLLQTVNTRIRRR